MSVHNCYECTICGEPPSINCAVCRAAWYCSLECQQTDLVAHGFLCRKLKDFSTAPNADSKLTILFGSGDDEPRFMWVMVKDSRTGLFKKEFQKSNESLFNMISGKKRRRSEDSPVLEIFFGENPSSVLIEKNPIRNRKLRGGLTVKGNKNPIGRPVNKALMNTIKAGKNWRCVKDPWVWRGDIMVMAYADETCGFVRDITMADYRNAVDYFSIYGCPKMTDILACYKRAMKITGVRINSIGLTIGSRRYPKFETVTFPQDHPITTRCPSPNWTIPHLLGLQLLISPYEMATASSPRSDILDRSHNMEARYLNTNLEPGTDSYGHAPIEWQAVRGRVQVIRSDGVALLPEHLDALCHYCSLEVQRLDVNAGRERAMSPSRITDADFEDFFYRYRADKGWDAALHSPYSI
jgi:MYND finger